MMFGNKELQVLYYISKGVDDVSGLSGSLDISVPETYRKIRLLRSKDVLDRDSLAVSCCPFAKRLMSIMSRGPGMAKYLSGSSIEVLISILAPRTIDSISKETGLSGSHVRKILRSEVEADIVRKTGDLYTINDNAIPKLRSFLMSYKDYLEVTDRRISDDSEIMFRRGGDVIFRSDNPQGFRPTGISVFRDYGVRGLPDGYGYYTTVEGEMDIETIFDDAVRIAEVENDWRLRMANELFYMKNRKRLKPTAEFLDKHQRVMSGEEIENWPSRQDIEDRMWMVS